MSHPKYQRVKEDFNSVGGASINLGHFRNKSNSSADFKSTFTAHENVSSSTQLVMPDKGLHTTKFGPGFQRRNEAQIKGIFADENQRATEQYQTMRASKSQALSQTRLQTLRDLDYRAGYNIITNQEVAQVSSKPYHRPEGIKMCGTGLGPEAPSRGRNTLRETEGRFFLPHATGKQHDYRQQVLCTEGINQAKCVSILQLGKKDLPSYGIDDQFAKSEYMKNSDYTKKGLYEATLPGKFTPRKIAGHPAANNQIVQNWTTNIDLHNQAVR